MEDTKVHGFETSAEQLEESCKGLVEKESFPIASSSSSSFSSSSSSSKAPLFLIRCDASSCAVPEPVPSTGISTHPTGSVIGGGGTHDAMLAWKQDTPPKNILFVKKWRDVEACDVATGLIQWLQGSFSQANICVYQAPGDEEIEDKEAVEENNEETDQMGTGTTSPTQKNEGKPQFQGPNRNIETEEDDQQEGPNNYERMTTTTTPTTQWPKYIPRLNLAPKIDTNGNNIARPSPCFCNEEDSTTVAAGESSSSSSSTSIHPEDVDLVVCVGGDGTVLHLSSLLFPSSHPPVIAVACGSFGFLTVHSEHSARRVLTKILNGKENHHLHTTTITTTNSSTATTSNTTTTTPTPTNNNNNHNNTNTNNRNDHDDTISLALPTAFHHHQYSASPKNSFVKQMNIDKTLITSPDEDVQKHLHHHYNPTPYHPHSHLHHHEQHLLQNNTHQPITHVSTPVSLRMRLAVAVIRASARTRVTRGAPTTSSQMTVSSSSSSPPTCISVLNELLLERGPSPFMASLNVFVDGLPLTTVNADGLILSTVTGSTAYNLSAGGPILQPAASAIVFTPICPHTLSFRPLVFSDTTELIIEVPIDARSSAWASFDGRNSTELKRGDCVVVKVSPWPLPLICRKNATYDWIRGIKSKLFWNTRSAQQKHFQPRQQQQYLRGQVVAESSKRVGTTTENRRTVSTKTNRTTTEVSPPSLPLAAPVSKERGLSSGSGSGNYTRNVKAGGRVGGRARILTSEEEEFVDLDALTASALAAVNVSNSSNDDDSDDDDENDNDGESVNTSDDDDDDDDDAIENNTVRGIRSRGSSSHGGGKAAVAGKVSSPTSSASTGTGGSGSGGSLLPYPVSSSSSTTTLGATVTQQPLLNDCKATLKHHDEMMLAGKVATHGRSISSSGSSSSTSGGAVESKK